MCTKLREMMCCQCSFTIGKTTPSAISAANGMRASSRCSFFPPTGSPKRPRNDTGQRYLLQCGGLTSKNGFLGWNICIRCAQLALPSDPHWQPHTQPCFTAQHPHTFHRMADPSSSLSPDFLQSMEEPLPGGMLGAGSLSGSSASIGLRGIVGHDLGREKFA